MNRDLAALVLERCDQLATCSAEADRITRPSYSSALRQAHALMSTWMRAAGMTVYEDAVGNLIGSYPADRSAACSLVIGSHLDSVRDAGRYDGPLGVLIGVAAVEALQRQGRRLPFALEVVAFADEEGLRFGAACLGSHAFSGRFDPAVLARRDASGITLAEAISAFGGDPDLITQDARRTSDLLGYLEVHIEQGPQLEAHNLALGIVSAITGMCRVALTFTGMAGHAGTVPMNLRHDALCAAAAFTLAAEDLARTIPGLVATVGQLTVAPGASNVIPGLVNLSLDLRHQDDATCQAALVTLHERAHALAAERGVSLVWDLIHQADAVPMAEPMRERLARAVTALGITPLELPSGAGHDAALLATITPAAMLFVRCKDGISHNPAEAVTLDDVAAAIGATRALLDELAL
ncbi:MAG: allantoate amidohydrolase [Oscillochloridaceae bacterium umkhey_bin13]